MSPLTPEQVAQAAVSAGLLALEDEQASQLARYGNLLLKWNARTNLTAISDPNTLLQRHLVESIAAAQALARASAGSLLHESAGLLDYGTGAGLPGIPIAICTPFLRVTLAESQLKKVAFLREAVRSLELGADIFAGRVAAMPRSASFGAVILRAVDKMDEAILDAVSRVAPEGLLALFATEGSEERLLAGLETTSVDRVLMPTVGHLLLIRGPVVPRPLFHVEQSPS